MDKFILAPFAHIQLKESHLNTQYRHHKHSFHTENLNAYLLYYNILHSVKRKIFYKNLITYLVLVNKIKKAAKPFSLDAPGHQTMATSIAIFTSITPFLRKSAPVAAMYRYRVQ